MKITVVLVAVLAGVVTSLASANGHAASFEARWPVAPMREPTLAEMARLVASVSREVANPTAYDGIAERQRRSWHCTAEFCRLVGVR
jgi:hypothetical protein